jgi:hypothetical protein
MRIDRPEVAVLMPVHDEAYAIEKVVGEFHENVGRKMLLEIA